MKPEIILVDRTDNVIGQKDRAQLAADDIYRVSALWITDGEGNILLAQRKYTKRHDPGKWGPAVAGTVEVGESYESNIYKEAEEEIHLIGTSFDLGPRQFVDLERSFFCQWYIATIAQEYAFIPQEEEVEKVEWVSSAVLSHELANQPEKYLDSMIETVKLFGV